MKKIILVLLSVICLLLQSGCLAPAGQYDRPPATSATSRPASTTTTRPVEEYKDGIHLSEVEDYVKKYIRKSDSKSEYIHDFTKAASELDDFFDDLEKGAKTYDLSFALDNLEILCDNGINYIKGDTGSSLCVEYDLFLVDHELDDQEKDVLRTIVAMARKSEEKINNWHNEIADIFAEATEAERNLTDTEITSVLELYNKILDEVEIYRKY